MSLCYCVLCFSVNADNTKCQMLNCFIFVNFCSSSSSTSSCGPAVCSVCVRKHSSLSSHYIFTRTVNTRANRSSPQHANQWMRYLAQTLADVRDDLTLIDAVLWSSPSAEGLEGGIVGCKEWGMGWKEREKPVGWGLDEFILTLYCQLMLGLFNWSWMDSKGQCWDAHTLYCSR